jgi:hypothetical protein
MLVTRFAPSPTGRLHKGHAIPRADAPPRSDRDLFFRDHAKQALEPAYGAVPLESRRRRSRGCPGRPGRPGTVTLVPHWLLI